MKSVRQKKQILDMAMLEEDFFEDAYLIGIVSPLPSYQIVWKINLAFNFQFRRNHEFEVELNENYFEVYNFIEYEKMVEHYFYTNRKKTHFLLEEAKKIDFIWMIKSSFLSEDYTKRLPQVLNQIKNIDYCFDMNPQQLKTKHLLIL